MKTSDCILYFLLFVNLFVLIEGMISISINKYPVFDTLLSRCINNGKMSLARILVFVCFFGYITYLLIALIRKKFILWREDIVNKKIEKEEEEIRRLTEEMSKICKQMKTNGRQREGE